jgi:hypothetical protein
LDEKPGEPVDSDVVYWNSSFQEFRWVWTGCSVLVFVMGAATVIRIKRKHCLEGRWIELLRPKTNPRANPVLTIEPLGRKTNPRADSVLAKDDYKLEITFTSGEVRVFDCTDVLDFGLFTELRDISYFKQARVESGTVVWPHGQDICPDTLYEGSEELG